MTTLKLEVGKSYRTRDGRKVTIKTYFDSYTFPFCDGGLNFFRPDGRFDFDKPHPQDLISEWQDEPESGGKTRIQIQIVSDNPYRDCPPDLRHLEEGINKLLEHGYVLHGQPYMDSKGGNYPATYQAMIKYVKDGE